MTTFYKRKLFRYRGEPVSQCYLRYLVEFLIDLCLWGIGAALVMVIVWEIVQGI